VSVAAESTTTVNTRGSTPPSIPADPEPQAIRSDLINRIFHFNTKVSFDRLGEFLLTFDFCFFNGSDQRIVRNDSPHGVIRPNFPSQPTIRLEDDPHYKGSQMKLVNEPFKEFRISLERRVSRDQASTITDHLRDGRPISFMFTRFHIEFGPVDRLKYVRPGLFINREIDLGALQRLGHEQPRHARAGDDNPKFAISHHTSQNGPDLHQPNFKLAATFPTTQVSNS
jgi:hypothetical protein